MDENKVRHIKWRLNSVKNKQINKINNFCDHHFIIYSNKCTILPVLSVRKQAALKVNITFPKYYEKRDP